MSKTLPAKEVELRDQQFDNIAQLVRQFTAYSAQGAPILSVDTKKPVAVPVEVNQSRGSFVSSARFTIIP